MTSTRRLLAVGCTLALAVAAGCSSSQTLGATTTSGPATTSTVAESTTTTGTAAPTTTAPATTAAPTTTAPSSGTCAGSAGIPPGADVGASISGDIDGDLVDDTVTEYSIGGVPHVHATLASGGQSDAEVAIGFADHVSISFEDFDYSLGAPTKPPVAVLAIGATKAGTAVYTFLTLTTQYCIQPWHDGSGTMWVGRISAEGPYEGLSCEIAAGSRYYAVNSAEPDGVGGWNVTQTVFRHNFTLIQFNPPLPVVNVPDGPTVQHQYGDFFGCDHPPLFP